MTGIAMRKTALVTVGEGYGNIVMATPTIAAVHAMGYLVDVLVESHQPDAATLLAGWDAVDTIYLERRTLQNAANLRKYDAVIRTVWTRGGALDAGPEFLPDPLPRQTVHEAHVNLSAARALGYAGPMPDPHVEMELPFWPLPDRFITVAPGYGGRNRTAWARKRWPHWREFCGLEHDLTGTHIVVLGTEADEEPWMSGPSRPWLHNSCGRTSIRGAAGVIERSEILISLDNGLAHIGAAVNRPVVVLFGATSEVKNRPLGKNVNVVTADLDCRSCQMTPRWERCSDYRCMRDISVDAVLSECELWRDECCEPIAAN